MTDFPRCATTLHLIPVEVWDHASSGASYLPDAFAADGFVHCTNGDENLIAVGNRYYTADPRPFLALIILVDRLTSPVRYDDSGRLFPHVYGPIARDAVVGKRAVIRGADGSFVAIDTETVPL